MHFIYDLLNLKGILEYAEIKLSWLDNKRFEHNWGKLARENNDYASLVELISECLPNKIRPVFDEKVVELDLTQKLDNAKGRAYRLLATDPVTGRLSFGLMGNLVDFTKGIDDPYHEFFSPKRMKQLIEPISESTFDVLGRYFEDKFSFLTK
ncbi:MAG: hypothetical protein WC307_00770 [Candidatus Nanoarchaeia archaeon]|jgi:hypothetical protein